MNILRKIKRSEIVLAFTALIAGAQAAVDAINSGVSTATVIKLAITAIIGFVARSQIWTDEEVEAIKEASPSAE